MRGYVAVSIDYRLEAAHWPPPELYPYVDALHDAKAAVRYMIKNAGELRLDSSRVAVFGSSAGAVLAYMLASVKSAGEGKSGNKGYPSNITAFASLSGELPPMFLQDMSAGDAPFVEVHGTKDGAIPYANATETKRQADALGIKNLFYTLEGAGHVPFADLEGNATMMFGLFDFLSTHLGLPAKGQGCPAKATTWLV
jgi:acetyl esterase/lipase